jgi:hypothetical protein
MKKVNMKVTGKYSLMAILAITILACGCTKDNLLDVRLQDGKAQIILSIDDPIDVETRSVATIKERTLEDAYLLVFDVTTGKYKAGEKINLVSQLANNGLQQQTLTPNVAIANGDTVVVLGNTGCTYESADIPLTPGTSTTADINAAFPSTDWDINRTVSREGEGMPMSGMLKYSVGAQCKMIRAVAKLQIIFADNLSRNDVTGLFYWGNPDMLFGVQSVLAPNCGLIYSPNYLSGVIIPTGITGSDFQGLIYSDQEESIIPEGTSFYATEYPSSVKAKIKTIGDGNFDKERTCMTIGFKDAGQYFRLDLYDKTAKKYLDIKRNCHYKIIITKVKSRGYSSLDEALANPGSNLEYEIIVSGDDDNVVVSNGQYAIILSSEAVLDSVSQVERTVLKAKYQLPTEMESLSATVNSIAFSGTGMTASSSNPTTLTSEWQELKLTFNNNATKGKFIFKLGNITKEVPVNFMKYIGMVIEGHKYRFAPGNLMYDIVAGEYYFAPNQGYYTGVTGEKWDPMKNTDYWYGGCLYTSEYYRWYYDGGKQFPAEIVGDPCTKVKPEGMWRTPSYEYLDKTNKTFLKGKYYDAVNARYVNGVFIDLEPDTEINEENQDDYLFLPAAGEKYPTHDQFSGVENGTDNSVGTHGFYWSRRKGELEADMGVTPSIQLQKYYNLDFDFSNEFFYNGHSGGVNPKARFTVRCVRYGDDGTD